MAEAVKVKSGRLTGDVFEIPGRGCFAIVAKGAGELRMLAPLEVLGERFAVAGFDYPRARHAEGAPILINLHLDGAERDALQEMTSEEVEIFSDPEASAHGD